VSETDVLKALENNGKKAVSFSEMQKILPQFGFYGQGYAAGYEQLKQLKIPVVVYIKLRGEDHFSVLRGINDDTVWLADSSYGNVKLSKTQFLNVWQTRQNENDDLKGKFLAVLPTKMDIKVKDSFFTKSPAKQTDLAIRAIGILKN
jgi:predicted double-glycine peptidase